MKLSVGSDSVDCLAKWQAARRAEASAAGRYAHVTRMWPKQAAALLDGGSLYWVVRGAVACRQRILALDARVGADGIRRCGIVLAPEIVLTQPQPRRPFQGWRYLNGQDAPADLGPYRAGETVLPASLACELAALGVL
ncbi:MAG: DUF1489 domain-containing protein [Pseudomonadota bacterium]